MNEHLNRICLFLAGMLLCLALAGCGGDSPWRYSPGVPVRPTALNAAPGSTQFSLSWTASPGAAGYNVYYATSPGVTISSGSKVANLKGETCIVTGLTNDVTYYCAVTALSSSGESALSAEVAVTPSAPGSFLQSDLQGTWSFNALATGVGARWMRGSAAIDGAGRVAVASYLDSAGTTTVPAGLFATLTILPDGFVSQAGAEVKLQGVLSANQYRDMLVATATLADSSRLLVIMQKKVPGITFASGDIKGTGRLVAGPLTYVYHQLASGSDQEWETGSCQVGQDQSVTYMSIDAPTARQLPGAGSKVVGLAITTDGLVTESPLAGVLPQPAAYLTNAVMSADKMTIVGTATDASGAFILRVIQLIHPPSLALSATSFGAADLAGTYAFHDLTSGAISSWAYGNLAIDLAGLAGDTFFLDSMGSSALPAPATVTMDGQGVLADALGPSYSGKLSYFKDMLVTTGTVAGSYRLGIALKR